MKKLLTFALVLVLGVCSAQNRFEKEFEKADIEFTKANSERRELIEELNQDKFESRLLDEKLIREAQLNAIAVIYKRKVKIRLKTPK